LGGWALTVGLAKATFKPDGPFLAGIQHHLFSIVSADNAAAYGMAERLAGPLHCS
jgi:hypothetical protein